MKIPPGKTEAEVLAAIEKAVDILAPGFVFGPYTLDDIKQEGRLEAIKLLEKDVYDTSRPLENLLYTHIKNRYINLVRDKLRRSDSPCPQCHSGFSCRPEGPCEKYVIWRDRNRVKSNIMRPLDLDHVADEHEQRTRVESTVTSEAELAELLAKIDAQLPAGLRSDYLKMRDGVTIPRTRKAQVEEAVKAIIGEE